MRFHFVDDTSLSTSTLEQWVDTALIHFHDVKLFSDNQSASVVYSSTTQRSLTSAQSVRIMVEEKIKCITLTLSSSQNLMSIVSKDISDKMKTSG